MLQVAGLSRRPYSSQQTVNARGQDLYWDVTNIPSGKYYIRLLIQSGYKTGEEEFRNSSPFLLLNGRSVSFNRATLLKLHNKLFYSIIQSAKPIAIKKGDQIRWNYQRKGKFGTLALAKNKLPFTPVWVSEYHGSLNDDLYRVSSTLTKGLNCNITNMTGSASKVNVSCRVLDYFGTELAKCNKRQELANAEKIVVKLPFKEGASDRYRAIITISDNKNNRVEKVVAKLANRNESMRPKMWLNKNWQWTSLKDDHTLKTRTLQPLSALSDNVKWGTVNLPSNWKDFKRDDHVAFFQKDIHAVAIYAWKTVFPVFFTGSYMMRIFI